MMFGGNRAWGTRGRKSRRPFLADLNTTAGAAVALRGTATQLHEALDVLRAELNRIAASATVDRAQVAALRDELEALGTAISDDIVALDAAQDEATLELIAADLEGLRVDVRRFAEQLRALEVGAGRSRAMTVVLWGGAAVSLAVGVGLFVRYLGRRQ